MWEQTVQNLQSGFYNIIEFSFIYLFVCLFIYLFIYSFVCLFSRSGYNFYPIYWKFALLL